MEIGTDARRQRCGLWFTSMKDSVIPSCVSLPDHMDYQRQCMRQIVLKSSSWYLKIETNNDYICYCLPRAGAQNRVTITS
jgi:hypothetical protein